MSDERPVSSERELDRLMEEFVARRRRGEDVSIETFATGHPRLRERILELFGVLLRVEDLGGAPSGPRMPAMRRWRLALDPANGTASVRPRGDTPVPGGAAEATVAGEPDRYQLVGEIGRGGMGVVLRVRDVDLGRDVAVKVLHDTLSSRPDVVARFVEEAQIGGQLQHPGIVPVHDIGRFEDGRPFFSMKLVQGRTLADALAGRADAQHERARFVGVFASICRTMAYAHSRAVVHRDLKPANVLVGSYGEVFVVDWGLSLVLSPEARRDTPVPAGTTVIETVRTAPDGTRSEVGSVFGTPWYMPPEQARGDLAHLDERADVFALGAILCEILSGRPPYSGTHADVVRAAAAGALDGGCERLARCGADPELVAIAQECLAPAPAARPRDAGELSKRIDAHLDGLERRADESRLAAAQERGRAEAERRARRVSTALATVAVLAVTGGVGGWAWAREREREHRDRADAAVLSAVAEANRLRERAESGDPAAWSQAVAAAGDAAALAESTTVGRGVAAHARSFAVGVRAAAARGAAEGDPAQRERVDIAPESMPPDRIDRESR